jgi:hypothetical protein
MIRLACPGRIASLGTPYFFPYPSLDLQMKNQSQKTHGMTKDNSATERSPIDPLATEARHRADAQIRLLGVLADAVVDSFRAGGSDSTATQ